MTANDMMTLRTLLEKSSDADLLREMIGFTAERLMAVEVAGDRVGLPGRPLARLPKSPSSSDSSRKRTAAWSGRSTLPPPGASTETRAARARKRLSASMRRWTSSGSASGWPGGSGSGVPACSAARRQHSSPKREIGILGLPRAAPDPLPLLRRAVDAALPREVHRALPLTPGPPRRRGHSSARASAAFQSASEPAFFSRCHSISSSASTVRITRRSTGAGRTGSGAAGSAPSRQRRTMNAEHDISAAAAASRRREMYGWRSERKQRLLDQLELQLDELEASATEDELAAEQAAAGTTEVKGFTRRKPARKPFPRTSSARAGGGTAADGLRVLRLGQAVEDRRGRDRDAGGDPAPLEGDPDGAREVHLPPLREDLPSRRRRSTRHPGAGPVRTFWR